MKLHRADQHKRHQWINEAFSYGAISSVPEADKHKAQVIENLKV